MTMYTQDPNFGQTVDFDEMRKVMRQVYDHIFPEFDLLKIMRTLTRLFDDHPSLMVAAGASMLAYQMIPAADEPEIAEEVKDSIFSLGWTEEHCGSDLLSIRTSATPVSDDPDEREYHIQGNKWMINNSYHADYHLVLAKVDPEQNGPRSLSLFLVPRSSCKNWERLETHVLTNMVLTKYDIDGPGRLLGKKGHGLSIVQRMAMPSKYQCTYMGVRMVHHAVPAAIEHLSTKNIFGTNPVDFSNVFRQMYTLSLQTALVDFIYYRSAVLNKGSWLQFHGTMLKSYLLLRVNEILSQNLLVAGSKGFVKESYIGQSVIDSFVLPVFDGHYTVNTFMTAKHAARYLSDEMPRVDESGRVDELRREMYVSAPHNELNAQPRDIRKPDFFHLVDAVEQMNLPIDLPMAEVVASVRALLDEIKDADLSNDPEQKYKTGDLIHWVEALFAACELWAVTENDDYLNAIVLQYNGLVTLFNTFVAEGGFKANFLQPMRMLPLPEVENKRAYLLGLCDVESQIRAFQGEEEEMMSVGD